MKKKTKCINCGAPITYQAPKDWWIHSDTAFYGCHYTKDFEYLVNYVATPKPKSYGKL